MKFTAQQIKSIVKLYTKDKLSTYAIAQQYSTYPNKITRLLKSCGVTLRTKSEAQKIAIDSGRHEHPTKGKQHSQEVRTKISENVHMYWQNLSVAIRKKRQLDSKRRWKAMPDEQKEDLRALAAEANREAAKNGSKMEIFLRLALTELGFQVIFHKRELIGNNQLELDLFIPALNTAIEIDGPAHFLPIWGQTNLDKHILADAKKSGLLLQAGYCIIRFKDKSKFLTEKYKRDTLAIIVKELKEIDRRFPPKTKRYIELEL